MDKWVNKVYKYTTRYYSAFKRRDILTHAATGMNFEDMMPSEINQSQQDRYCMFPLYEFTETERWLPGAVRRGERGVV